jgi:hypothetical protein
MDVPKCVKGQEEARAIESHDCCEENGDNDYVSNFQEDDASVMEEGGDEGSLIHKSSRMGEQSTEKVKAKVKAAKLAKATSVEKEKCGNKVTGAESTLNRKPYSHKQAKATSTKDADLVNEEEAELISHIAGLSLNKSDDMIMKEPKKPKSKLTVAPDRAINAKKATNTAGEDSEESEEFFSLVGDVLQCTAGAKDSKEIAQASIEKTTKAAYKKDSEELFCCNEDVADVPIILKLLAFIFCLLIYYPIVVFAMENPNSLAGKIVLSSADIGSFVLAAALKLGEIVCIIYEDTWEERNSLHDLL